MVDTAWSLLLAALVVTPLLTTNLSWLPGSRPVWLVSGSPLFKALILQALVGAAIAFFALAVRKGEAVVRWHPAAWLGAAVLAWAGVAVATSVSPATALLGYHANAEGWMALASYVGAAFLVLQLVDSSSRTRSLLTVSSLAAAAVAVYGLLQTFGFDPLKWEVTNWGEYRSFGTVGNPDMFGAFMVLNLFVLVGLLLSEKEARWRLIYGAAAVAVGTASFTSLSRAAWIGAIAGAVVFVVFALKLRVRFTAMHAALVGALVLTIVAASVHSLPSWDPDSNVAHRAAAAFNPNDKNTLGRTETWRVAGAALAKRPVFGYGPDTFALAFQPLKTEPFARLVEPNIVQANAHSSIIQIAVERGVPGALLWLALLGAVTATALPVVLHGDPKTSPARLLLAGVIASAAGYVVTSLLTPTSHEASLLLWCMLALLIAPVAKETAVPALKRFAAVPLVAGVLAVAVALAFLFADTRAAIADDEGVASAERIAAADAAVRLDPLNPEYQAIGAKAYAQSMLQDPSLSPDVVRARFDHASALMRQAVALAPTDTHARATLASLLLIGGEKVDARYYEQAVEVSASALKDAPNDLETAYWYARALNADGRGPEAVPVLERTLKLRPGFGDAALLLSDLYVAGKDEAAARALLERTIPLVPRPEVLQERLTRIGGGTGK